MAPKKVERPRPEKDHPYSKGDRLMIKGEHGTYKLYDERPYYDGSLLIYGGDKDRNGVQMFRSIMPDRLKPDKRSHTKRKDDDVDAV